MAYHTTAFFTVGSSPSAAVEASLFCCSHCLLAQGRFRVPLVFTVQTFSKSQRHKLLNSSI